MATRTTILRNTGLIAQAGEVVAKTGKPVVIKRARYASKSEREAAARESRSVKYDRVLKNVKVLKVVKARENNMLIATTVDSLGNVRNFNTAGLIGTHIPSLG